MLVKPLTCLAILLVLLPKDVLALNFEVFRSTEDGIVKIKASGPIEKGDCAELRTFVNEATLSGELVRTLRIESPGGQLAEGLCLGRLVRDLRLATDADETNVCASACALVWLGGLYRVGEVFGHHPYAQVTESSDADEFLEKVGSERDDVYDFVREMNLPPSIADRILSQPSTDLVRISASEDLIHFDPVFYEFATAKCGSELTMDEQTLLKILRENQEEGLKQDDPIYIYAHRQLEEREANWSSCVVEKLSQLQKVAQTQ